jgi:hypothetical protein
MTREAMPLFGVAELEIPSENFQGGQVNRNVVIVFGIMRSCWRREEKVGGVEKARELNHLELECNIKWGMVVFVECCNAQEGKHCTESDDGPSESSEQVRS